MKKTYLKENYFSPEQGTSFFTALREFFANIFAMKIRYPDMVQSALARVYFLQSSDKLRLIVTDNCTGVRGQEGYDQFFARGKKDEDKDPKTWSEYGVGWDQSVRFLVKKNQNALGQVAAIYIPNNEEGDRGWISSITDPASKTFEAELFEYYDVTLDQFKEDYGIPEDIEISGVTYVIENPCLELPNGLDLTDVLNKSRNDKRKRKLWDIFHTSLFPEYGENYYHMCKVAGFEKEVFDIIIEHRKVCQDNPNGIIDCSFSLLESVKEGYCNIPVIDQSKKNVLDLADNPTFAKPFGGKESWTMDITDPETGDVIYDEVTFTMASRTKDHGAMTTISEAKGKKLSKDFEEKLNKYKKYADNKWFQPSGTKQTHLTRINFGGLYITSTSKFLPILNPSLSTSDSSTRVTEGEHQANKWSTVHFEIHFDGLKRPKTTGTKVELDDASLSVLSDFFKFNENHLDIISMKTRACEIRDTIKTKQDLKGFSEESLEQVLREFYITADPKRQWQVPIGSANTPALTKNPLKVDSGSANDKGGLDYLEVKKGELTAVGPSGIIAQLLTYGASMDSTKDSLKFIGESIHQTAVNAAELVADLLDIDVKLGTYEDIPLVHQLLRLRAEQEGVCYPSTSKD